MSTLFSNKVLQAEKVFKDGGIYICSVCDGECQHCDDDYQCSECEIMESDMLEDEYRRLNNDS
jgi:predicted metal-binding protein